MNERITPESSEPGPIIIRRPNDPDRLDALARQADAYHALVFDGWPAGARVEELMISDYHTINPARRYQRTDALLKWFALDQVLVCGEIDGEEFVDAVCRSEELEEPFYSFRRHNIEGLEARVRSALATVDDLCGGESR